MDSDLSNLPLSEPTPSILDVLSAGGETASDSPQTLSSALVSVNQAVESLGIPELKDGIKSLVEVLDNVRQNGLQNHELVKRLYHFKNAVITPLLLGHEVPGSSLDLDARIGRLTSRLSEFAKHWERLKDPPEQRTHFDYEHATKDMESRIYEMVNEFSLQNPFVDGSENPHLHSRDTPKVTHRCLSKVVLELAHAAAGNESESRIGAPTCLAGTQESVLNTIDIWFHASNQTMLLLKGGPGTGKSTIARTIAARAADTGSLVTSFFFSTSDTSRKSPNIFFPSIAFQLAQFSKEFEGSISKVFQQSQGVESKPLSLQLEQLTQALNAVEQTSPRLLVVVDALDESEKEGAADILRLLLDGLSVLPPWLKVLLTTRPEPHLQSVLDASSTHDKLIQCQIGEVTSEDEIQRFLRHQFSETKVLHGLTGSMCHIEPADLTALAKAAGQSYLTAFVTAEFIKDSTTRVPQQQLDTVLRNIARQGEHIGPSSTLLDYLYNQILEAAFPASAPAEADVALFQDVIGALTALGEPLPLQVMCNLLNMEFSDAEHTISRLKFIIASHHNRLLQFFHPSFPNFITSPDYLKEKFLIRPAKQHERIAGHCLDLIGSKLKRNICKIPFPECYFENDAIPELEALIKEHVSQELVYACHHWAGHLVNSPHDSDGLTARLMDFVSLHLLSWLEVLSLTGSLRLASPALRQAERYTTLCDAPKRVVLMLKDAQRFVEKYHKIIQVSALHVYYSALPSTPNETEIYNVYSAETERSVCVLRGRKKKWDPLAPILRGHSGQVRGVAYSNDGKRLASVSSDNTLRVWDAATGEEIAVGSASDTLNSVMFSCDNARIATASEDHKVQLWNSTTAASIIIMEGHTDRVWNAAFSPDGNRLASASVDKTIRIWDGTTGAHITTIEGHSKVVDSVAFSPDGTKLASTSVDGTIRLWSASTWALEATLGDHSTGMWCGVFSPDGTRIATAATNGTSTLWETTGKHIATMNGHSTYVASVAFSADGSQVFSAAKDCTFKVWDAASGAHIATLNQPSVGAFSVAVSPDGSQIAAGCYENTVRLWDITSPTPHSDDVDIILFSPHAIHLASASSDTLRLWSAIDGIQKPILRDVPELVKDAIFSHDDSKCISTSDKAIQVWEILTGTQLATLEGHAGAVSIILLSPDGTRLASTSSDNTIRLWDTTSWAQSALLEANDVRILSVIFSPNSLLLASGCDDFTIRLWNATSGALIAALEGHSGPVGKVAFSPCNTKLASASNDNHVRIWDTSGGTLAILEGHSRPVLDVAFSPNGVQIASGSQDMTIRVWDTTSGADVGTLVGHEGSVWEVVYSPDNSRLASASDDLTIRLWEMKTNTQIFTLGRHFCLPDISSLFTEFSTHVVERRDHPVLVRLHNHPDGSITEVPIYWLPDNVKPTRSRCSGGFVAIGTTSGQLFHINTAQWRYSGDVSM